MTSSSNSQPPSAHTQCATGKYTKVTQSVMNSAQELNFTRSASAPLIRAGVRTANISWNVTNAKTGMPSSPPVSVVASMPLRPMWSKLPMTPPLSEPKASE